MNSTTAAEFAAARFAQHPGGRFAMRYATPAGRPWVTDNMEPRTDVQMSVGGWRIVTPAPDPSDPDVIEQAARRGYEAWRESWGHNGAWEERAEVGRDSWRAVARAILTPPPARDPEAEKLASALARALPAPVAIHFDGDALDATADALLAEGVRVGGGEDRACGRGPCCLEDGHDGECRL